MPRVWNIPPRKKADIIEQLLLNRNIRNDQERQDFINPQLSQYTKSFQIPGISLARERILQAIKNDELIIIYGDYDVDGVCATAIMYLGLTSIGARVFPYIPHREKEGYGLSKEGLSSVKQKGGKLVITVDNGIVALEQAKYAKELGLDLIITDHHTATTDQPDALSIIHSTQICGAAVAWSLIKSLLPAEEAEELLDLVALATIGDLLPLLGVNRALVKEGLKQLNNTKKVGLLALIIESGINLGEVNSFRVGHLLGPKLNAIGRLEHSIDALRLLCTKDIAKARRLAKLLAETNDQKKKLTSEAVDLAKQMIVQQNGAFLQKKILILHSTEWIPGIIGLVASRLSEEYNLPTIVIAEGVNGSKGSARSVNGVNIVDLIRKGGELLLDVGGHPQAAGFTIKADQTANFVKRMEDLMEMVDLNEQQPLNIDVQLHLAEINKNLINTLDVLEPVGMANPQPIFALKAVPLSDIKTVGNGQHLKFKAGEIETIAFSQGKLASKLVNGQKVDLAFNLEIDKFNGAEKVQLKIVDLHAENI
ncbi:single-stranded-DNA-specific exonuclease RecJ [Patescibacteria group bacterium]|nr:single-stranded-DNA-specific exonuclease RecJ [Patescibacteria group bacterium]